MQAHRIDVCRQTLHWPSHQYRYWLITYCILHYRGHTANKRGRNKSLEKQRAFFLMTQRLSFLDSLRALAIIMVVGVHTLGYCVELPLNQWEVVSFVVHAIAVPVFFLVDGYLFARSATGSEDHGSRKYVRNSVVRLLLPWVVFTLVYTTARYAFELTGFLQERLILGHSWAEVALSAYGSVYAPQMYFLFSLFLIRLSSPLLKRSVVTRDYFVLLSVFLCYFAGYKALIPHLSPHLEITGGQEPILHALRGMQFYLLGIVVFRTSTILTVKKLFVPILLLFAISLFIRGTSEDRASTLVQYLYLLTVFFLFAFFPNGFRPLNWLGRNTMGIYLIHTPIVLKGISLVLNAFVRIPMLSFVSVLLGTLAISIPVVAAINFVPYGRLLFGTPYREGQTGQERLR
jgi:surface polysaccharide O-acyltransferase-like enzyme